MRTLFLHIGHPKTGSTYLQLCFAASGDALHAHGLVYPFDNPIVASHHPGSMVTDGNARQAFESLESLSRHLATLADDGRSVLLSSEYFELYLSDPAHVPGLWEVAVRHGFGRVSLLLFVRDPLERLLSGMLQTHKIPFSRLPSFSCQKEWLYNILTRWHRYLAALEAHPGMTATVRNYGRWRHRLEAVAEEWLGMPEGSLLRPPLGVVNRSLTPDEAFLVSAIKTRMAPPYPDLGWSLVARAPGLSAPIRWPSRELQEDVCRLCREPLEALNRYLPPDEPLVCEVREPSPPMEEVTFSGTQLAAVGRPPSSRTGWAWLRAPCRPPFPRPGAGSSRPRRSYSWSRPFGMPATPSPR